MMVCQGHRPEFETTLHFIKKHFPRRGLILDAGGGLRRYTVTLASQGYDVIMLDMTPANVAFAKRQIKRSGVPDRVKAVVEGSIVDLSRFADNTFDGVICLLVLSDLDSYHICIYSLGNLIINEAKLMSPPLAKTLHDWTRVVMQHSMRNIMLQAKEHNYSMAQLNALFRIKRKGTCGVSDLGEEMGVTSAAASQLLERLVQQGLTVRTEDPQDRRNKLVTLTEAGERIIQESAAAHQNWLTQVADLLSPDEQKLVNAALQLLIEKTTLLDKTTADQ